jgi:hypothetical protein
MPSFHPQRSTSHERYPQNLDERSPPCEWIGVLAGTTGKRKEGGGYFCKVMLALAAMLGRCY